jgi:ribosomal protein S18 acetylase RimI-like enzyme
MTDFELRPVTLKNRGDLEHIHAGEQAQFWLQRHWVWHQHALENNHIVFRLIHIPSVVPAVGMVAYGPAYADEQHTIGILGDFELLHLVIDARYQRRGLGRAVAVQVLRILATEPDCKRILLTLNPANTPGKAFVEQLGFLPIAQKHYDGDPMWAIATR